MISSSELDEFILRMASKDPKLQAFLDKQKEDKAIWSQFGIIKDAFPYLQDGIRYYDLAKREGFSKEIAMDGASLAVATKVILQVGGGALVRTGAVTISGGGQIATKLLVFGRHTLLGLVAGGIGTVSSWKAEEVALGVLYGYCGLAKHGGILEAVRSGVKGLLYQSHEKPDTYNYLSLSDALSQSASTILFEKKLHQYLQNSDYLDDGQKAVILDDFNKKKYTQSFLQSLGINHLDIDEELFEFISHPSPSSPYFRAEDPIIRYAGNMDFDLNIIDPKNQLKKDPISSAKIQDLLRQNSNTLQSNQSLLIKGTLQKPVNNKRKEKIGTNIGEQIISECQLSDEQMKVFKDLQESLSIKTTDGTTITLSGAIKKYLDNLSQPRTPEQIAQEKQEGKNLKIREIQGKYQEQLHITDSLIIVGQLIGSYELQKFGQAAGGLSSMAAGVALASTGQIPLAIHTFLEGLSQFISSVKKEEKVVNPFQILSEQLKDLTLRIEAVKRLVLEGNIRIEAQLAQLWNAAHQKFSTILVELYTNRLILGKKLDNIQAGLHQLSIQVNKSVYFINLDKLRDGLFKLNNSELRYGTLKNLTFREYDSYCNKFIIWLTNKPSHEIVIGTHLYWTNEDPKRFCEIYTQYEPEEIVGFMMLHANQRLGLNLPISELYNPNVWLMAVYGYNKLLQNTGNKYLLKRDPDLKEYQEILNAGLNIISFYDQLYQNVRLFSALFREYQKTLEESATRLDSVVYAYTLNTGNEKIQNSVVKQEENVNLLVLDIPSAFNDTIYNILSFYSHKHQQQDTLTTLRRWRDLVTQDKFPQLINVYLTRLKKDLESLKNSSLDTIAPLQLTIPNSFFAQYPLLTSQLFTPKNIDLLIANMPNLKDYLKGERLQLGNLTYQLQGYKREGYKTSFQVKIFFAQNEMDQVEIGSVWMESEDDEFVRLIDSLYMIQPTDYQGEVDNPYKQNAEQMRSIAAYLGGWLQAKVVKVSANMIILPHLKDVINAQVNIGDDHFIRGLCRDLQTEEETFDFRGYSLALNNIKESLYKHEASVNQILAFARLLEVPEAALSPLYQLWDKNLFLASIQQYLTMAPSCRRPVKELVNWHLDPSYMLNSMQCSYGGSKLSEIERNFYQAMEQSTDAAPVQTAIKSALNNLIDFAKTRDFPLNQEIITRFGNCNLSSKLILNAEPYSAAIIDNLLEFYLGNESNANYVTPFFPSDPEMPVFLSKQFSKDVIQAIREAINNSITTFFPLAFIEENNGKKEKIWVLLVIKKNNEQEFCAHYIDPTADMQENGNHFVTLTPPDLCGDLPSITPADKRLSLFISHFKWPLTSRRIAEIAGILRVEKVRQIETEPSLASGVVLIQNVIDIKNNRPLTGYNWRHFYIQQRKDLLSFNPEPALLSSDAKQFIKNKNLLKIPRDYKAVYSNQANVPILEEAQRVPTWPKPQRFNITTIKPFPVLSFSTTLPSTEHAVAVSSYEKKLQEIGLFDLSAHSIVFSQSNASKELATVDSEIPLPPHKLGFVGRLSNPVFSQCIFTGQTQIPSDLPIRIKKREPILDVLHSLGLFSLPPGCKLVGAIANQQIPTVAEVTTELPLEKPFAGKKTEPFNKTELRATKFLTKDTISEREQTDVLLNVNPRKTSDLSAVLIEKMKELNLISSETEKGVEHRFGSSAQPTPAGGEIITQFNNSELILSNPTNSEQAQNKIKATPRRHR